MKIGLDIGSNTSTLAYVDDGTLRRFAYGDASLCSSEEIPTAVACSPAGTLIGRSAILDPTEQAAMYRYFKNDLKERSAASPSPTELTAVFLGTLLLEKPPAGISARHPSSAESSFEKFSGERIERIVVPVPQSWAGATNPGRSALREILMGTLRVTDVQLVDDAVSSAAYYRCRHEAQRGSSVNGSILIWDLGGGGQTASICTFKDDNLEVAAHVTSEIGGNSFDRALVLESFGADLSEREMANLMWKMDQQKRDKGAARRLKNQAGTDRVANLPIYTLSNDAGSLSEQPDVRRISLDQVHKAFATIKAEIHSVLGKLLAAGPNYEIKSIVPVGGFARFPMVQDALREASREFFNGQDILECEVLDDDDMVYSAAYGAALIANDLATISEVFDGHVSLLATSLSGEDVELSLITAGSRRDRLGDPRFCTDADGNQSVFKLSSDRINVEVEVGTAGAGTELRTIELLSIPFTGTERWMIGAYLDETQTPNLVLSRTIGRVEYEYPLPDHD